MVVTKSYPMVGVVKEIVQLGYGSGRDQESCKVGGARRVAM